MGKIGPSDRWRIRGRECHQQYLCVARLWLGGNKSPCWWKLRVDKEYWEQPNPKKIQITKKRDKANAKKTHTHTQNQTNTTYLQRIVGIYASVHFLNVYNNSSLTTLFIWWNAKCEKRIKPQRRHIYARHGTAQQVFYKTRCECALSLRCRWVVNIKWPKRRFKWERESARERGGRTRVFMQIEWESSFVYFKQTLVLWTYNMNYMLRKCICRLVNCSLCFCFVLIGVRNQCYSNVDEFFTHPSWNRHPFGSLWN